MVNNQTETKSKEWKQYLPQDSYQSETRLGQQTGQNALQINTLNRQGIHLSAESG